MEFLLINHPLDCPVWRPGRRVRLPDLAVGYGASASRYHEEKRVVLTRNWPLVSAEEIAVVLTAPVVCVCIELAAVMELGQGFRGEHAEIMSFVSGTVDSELSGNMIDLCPSARSPANPSASVPHLGVSRRKSVTPHDSLGQNLAGAGKKQSRDACAAARERSRHECMISY